jgi:hypothetical protein
VRINGGIGHIPSIKAETDASGMSLSTVTDTIRCAGLSFSPLLTWTYPVCWLEPLVLASAGRSMHTMLNPSGLVNLFMHIVFGGHRPFFQYRIKSSPMHRSAHSTSFISDRQILPIQSLGWRHCWSVGGVARFASECVRLSDCTAATSPLDAVGDAKVEWRWLAVRKIVVKIVEKSMIWGGKYREKAKVNPLRANPLLKGHIYRS